MFVIFLMIFNTSSFAGGLCPQPDAVIRDQVLKLVESVRSGDAPQIQSVDDFVGALPEEMRKNYLFITKSRSLQASNRKHPRVILYSPNADVSLSFGTDPELRGYNRIEIMHWDGEKAKFNFIDVEFPADDPKVNLEAVSRPPQPTVTHNPDACFKCHGVPARPNWDTYRTWYGLTPFSRDKVCAGTEEAMWLDSFLEQIEQGKPRYRHLGETYPRMIDYMRDFIKFADKKNRLGRSRRFGDRPNGVGVVFFDQLTKKNQCRIGHDIKRNKNINTYRYAMAAAIHGCRDLKEALPEWAQDKAIDYFKSKGVELKRSENGGISLKPLLSKTRQLQNTFHNEKIERQMEFFREELGNGANEEIAKHQNCRLEENVEKSGEIVTKLRFLVEPFEAPGDVKMSSWSMSIDPATYTFADNFKPINFDVVKKVFSEFHKENLFKLVFYTKNALESPPGDLKKFCDWAFQKSRGAFNKNTELRDYRPQVNPCITRSNSIGETFEESANSILSIDLILLRRKAKEVFKNKCVMCHASGGPLNAPRIDMLDTEKFEKLIKSTTGREGNDWSLRIWERINRLPEDHGRMPKIISPLSDDERSYLRHYLDTLRVQSRFERNN